MPYGANPSTDDSDAVRLLVGDTSTSSTGVLLTDDEYDFFLSEESNKYFAAAQAANTLSGKFADEVDKQIGDLRLDVSEKADNYASLSKSLRRRGQILSRPVIPARSQDDKDTARDDSDRVEPFFTRGNFDNPEGPSGSTS